MSILADMEPINPAIVPGKMRCAKCNFTLQRRTMFMRSGTIGDGDNQTEPCPNGCGPLWPMSWKQEADELGERLEAIFFEKRAIEQAHTNLLSLFDDAGMFVGTLDQQIAAVKAAKRAVAE